MFTRTSALAAVLCLSTAVPASAQSRGGANVTLNGGYAGFADEGLISHGALGAGLEWQPTAHIAVGPEVLYMIGPGSDRDLFLLGVLRVGVLPWHRRVSPFITAGLGIMRNSNEFLSGTYSSTEGAYVIGGGVRFAVSPRVFVAPEFTIGWEPHLRTSISVGIRLP